MARLSEEREKELRQWVADGNPIGVGDTRKLLTELDATRRDLERNVKERDEAVIAASREKGMNEVAGEYLKNKDEEISRLKSELATRCFTEEELVELLVAWACMCKQKGWAMKESSARTFLANRKEKT